MQLFYTFDIESGGGGVSRFAIDLGRKLNHNEFLVTLCSLGKFDQCITSKKRISMLKKENIKASAATIWVDDRPYHSFYNSFSSLRKLIEKNPVDIIHSHSEYTDVTAILLKISRNVSKIIRTVHYGYPHEWHKSRWRQYIFTNFLYPLYFNAEIGINQVNTDRLNHRRIARILKKNSSRIYNAIELERLNNKNVDISALKKLLNIPNSAPIVGTVGRLSEQKGYFYFIKSIKIILEQRPDVYFLIVGDGPLKEELMKQATENKSSKQIIFTGPRTDVDELLACFSIFVSSSLWEGLPTVLLESMACQVPIVATDIPGTNELINHNVNGWLVPPRNETELASAILKLLEKPDLGVELGKNGLETIYNFSINRITKEYEQLYYQIYNQS